MSLIILIISATAVTATNSTLNTDISSNSIQNENTVTSNNIKLNSNSNTINDSIGSNNLNKENEKTNTLLEDNNKTVIAPTINTLEYTGLKGSQENHTIYVSVNGTGDGFNENNATNLTYGINYTSNSDYNWTMIIDGGDYYFTDHYILNKTITMIGASDGTTCFIQNHTANQNYGGMFYSPTNSNKITLSLSNINFINGSSKTSGGAIQVGDPNNGKNSLIVNNCNFTNCNVTDGTGAGGAIAFFTSGVANGGTVYITINNTNFINNNARMYGGALRIQATPTATLRNGIVSITNCNFSGNTVLGSKDGYARGGAINVNINCTIDNCSFINNIADDSGGAIRTDMPLTVLNSYFNNNSIIGKFNTTKTPETSGLSIYNNNGEATQTKGSLYIKNSTFVNHNYTKNDINKNYTGIIKNSGNIIVVIEDCTFKDNSVEYGVIYNEGSDVRINGTSNFENNSVYTGTIYNKGENASIIFNNVNFTSNNANISGGIIYNTGGNISINNSIFENNMAKINGTIYNLGGDLDVYNSSFINNTAISNGGVFYNNGGSIDINYSVMLNNTGNNGAVIYNRNNATNEFNITNSVISNNSATANGVINTGGIDDNGIPTINIINCTCEYNNATNGGFIYTAANVIINNSNINYNYAKVNGGAICNVENITLNFASVLPVSYINSINIYNSNLTFNKADNNGGVAYNQGQIELNNTIMYNNTASNGGVIYTENPYDGTDFIDNSVIFNNSADNNGGVIFNTKGSFNIYIIVTLQIINVIMVEYYIIMEQQL
ncbi:MAG: hypothetical protein Q4Q23_03660 [Methanobacteriaceae archaeon]|nr:hypothetical protein [Methanobacteriaceae archaeon]